MPYEHFAQNDFVHDWIRFLRDRLHARLRDEPLCTELRSKLSDPINDSKEAVRHDRIRAHQGIVSQTK
jgi:hypothetical protein